MWEEVQSTGRPEVAGDRGARGVQERARLQIGSGARGGVRGGAHGEHPVHVRDAGGVKAQRLVEHRRVLPSRKESIYGAGQGAGRETEGRGAGAQAVCRGRAWLDIGRRACAKGTANMLLTRMTLDVSKLSGWLNTST